MAIFRKKSVASEGSDGKVKNVSITKADEQHYKVRTGSVHDPILQAMNEAQPFENSVPDDPQRQSYQGPAQLGMYDVFGQPISKPDISNPTRSRDERPLDTIRAFEYAITGDQTYKDRLETERLGFRVRQDFPQFGSNPYGGNGGGNASGPVHSFSGADQAVYVAPERAVEEKKTKRGLFGRKKKN